MGVWAITRRCIKLTAEDPPASPTRRLKRRERRHLSRRVMLYQHRVDVRRLFEKDSARTFVTYRLKRSEPPRPRLTLRRALGSYRRCSARLDVGLRTSILRKPIRMPGWLHRRRPTHQDVPAPRHPT
jgi:hypothetical protein